MRRPYQADYGPILPEIFAFAARISVCSGPWIVTYARVQVRLSFVRGDNVCGQRTASMIRPLQIGRSKSRKQSPGLVTPLRAGYAAPRRV
jgi:hypothetical protein